LASDFAACRLCDVTKAARVLDHKYKLGRLLHKGERAIIVEARHLELREPVAIKVLDTEHRDPRFAARLRREARQSAAIKSDHVVRYLDIGHLTDGRPYVVMERLVGNTVADRIAHGPLSVPDAVDVMLQACEAVACAHVRGVLHRSLQSSNLFCVEQPDNSIFVKVLNFGTARAIDPQGQQEDHGLTVAGFGLDAPDYRAPEQIVGRRDLDGRVDIWALGVILYEMLAGTRPFMGASAQEVVRRVLVADIAPSPQIPLPLMNIIDGCLKGRVEERWANVADLADALAPFAGPTTQRYAARIRQILSAPPPAEPETELEEEDHAPTVVRDVLALARDTHTTGTQQILVTESGLPRIDDGRTGARSFPWFRVDLARRKVEDAAQQQPPPPRSRGMLLGIFVATFLSVAALIVLLMQRLSVDLHIEPRDPRAAAPASAPLNRAADPAPPSPPAANAAPAATTTTASATTTAAAPADPSPPQTGGAPANVAPMARATPAPAQRNNPAVRTTAGHAGPAGSAKAPANEDPWGWER
jgi:serine/threonine-protein kinase